MQNQSKFIVVIGTSAGGFNALPEVLSQLNPEMNAAFFVVMHISKQGIGNYLVNRMQKYTELTCKEATNNEEIKSGTIYFASPDKHLVIKNDRIFLGCGPEENHWRPSIDVLFRSAAVSWNTHTIGILLTGMLYDGTSGMAAIHKCGGTCVVQDPNEADFPEMPISALNEGIVDHSVPLYQMGALLENIISSEREVKTDIPIELIKEVNISLNASSDIDELETIGERSVFTCPDCGGVLFNMNEGKISRYRCHTGHAYNVDDLENQQNKNLENALWVSLRMIEERRKLLAQLSEKNLKKGFRLSAANYQAKIDELQTHSDALRKILFENEAFEKKSA